MKPMAKQIVITVVSGVITAYVVHKFLTKQTKKVADRPTFYV